MAVTPRLSEGLLQDCEAPVLVPDPDNANAEQINEERLSVAQWGKCNQTKFWSIRDWVRRLQSGK